MATHAENSMTNHKTSVQRRNDRMFAIFEGAKNEKRGLVSCSHLKTKKNGLCIKCGYNTLGLTNKELAQFKKDEQAIQKILTRIPNPLDDFKGFAKGVKERISSRTGDVDINDIPF